MLPAPVCTALGGLVKRATTKQLQSTKTTIFFSTEWFILRTFKLERQQILLF